MKRIIRSAALPYRVIHDERRESLRLGKYVYLTMIAALMLFLLHRAFGHLYLLEGDGFVHAKGYTVALQFDATVSKLFVSDGDRVRQGDLLLRHDSVWFDERAVNLATNITRFQQQLSEDRIQSARLDAAIASSRDEVALSRDLQTRSRELSTKGLIDNERLSNLVHRYHDAERKLLEMQAERDQLQKEIGPMEVNLARVEQHYQDFVATFNDGDVRAPVDGVVANLTVNEGAVVTDGAPILQIYGDQRYILAYLDDRSPVDYRSGDPILLSFPANNWVMGRVGDLTAVADRLPEEFQPRFKPAARNRLVKVEVTDDRLAQVSMLGTVRLYKPLGFDLLRRWGAEFATDVAER